MISNGDFANTVLITVGWAYNDVNYYSSLNFGNPTDPIPESTTGITTFLGYYCKVLDMLQKAAPTATVILVNNTQNTLSGMKIRLISSVTNIMLLKMSKP